MKLDCISVYIVRIAVFLIIKSDNKNELYIIVLAAVIQ